MTIIRRIDDGDELPRGYGICWRVPWLRQLSCAPVPLCFVLRVIHWAYWGLALWWLPARKLEARLRRRYESYGASPVFPRLGVAVSQWRT